MYIGTAAWNIPEIESESFPSFGSHLERYSQILNAVEINSSFYRDHMPKSYAKWASTTPEAFRFSVKLNQRFTHECDLKVSSIDLATNLRGIQYLGEKWGVLLLQFPGRQLFHAQRMEKIYRTIRTVYRGMVALEARNESWFTPEAINLMANYGISKVSADPEKAISGHIGEDHYYRLHGSPEIYRSNYSQEYIHQLYEELKNKPNEIWCIFDNTTFGHATSNALMLKYLKDHDERRTKLFDARATIVHALN